jgi:CheY-like chemotaxis protein
MDADNQAGTTFRGLTVLAADDNAANRLMLKSALELFGLFAVVVADGDAAVEAWSTMAIDILLLDIEMPRMNGPSALAVIREAERARGLARTPAIAFSGHDSAHLARSHRGHDFDLHVSKPVALSQLRQALSLAAALKGLSGPFGTIELRNMV